MWVDNNNEEENQNNATPGNNLNVGAGGGVSAPTSGTSSNPSTQTPIQSNQPQQQFATVQDYLKGNQNQGEQLGQDLTGKLSNTANQEQSTISNAATQAGNDINNGTVNYNADLVSQAKSNPTSVANSPDQLNSFLQQWNAAYSGPSSFEASNEYAPAAQAANEASQNQQEIKTTGGQQQLLQDQYGVYGQGNKGLDQAVLQNSSYYPTLQNEGNQFGNVQDYLTNQSGALDTQAQNAAATTAATQQQTQGAFANNLTDFQNNLNARVAGQQTAQQTAATQYQQDLASGNVDAITKDLQNAGVSPDQIQSITGYLKNLNTDYGVTPDLSNQYAFNPAVDINAGNVATAQDYASAAAYGQLTGTDYSGVLNPANAAQAGTAAQANSGINSAGISDYLKSQLGQQDTSLLQNNSDVINGIHTAKLGAQDAANEAQKYIDAATREGKGLNDVPAMQKLLQDSKVALNGALQEGKTANSPDVKSYQAIIDKLSSFASQPATSNPVQVTTPGTPTPTNRGGSTTTPVNPSQITSPKQINGMDANQLQSKVLDQLKSTPATNIGSQQRNTIQNDANQIKNLYQQYLDGNITATNYVGLQQLLKKYNLG